MYDYAPHGRADIDYRVSARWNPRSSAAGELTQSDDRPSSHGTLPRSADTGKLKRQLCNRTDRLLDPEEGLVMHSVRSWKAQTCC